MIIISVVCPWALQTSVFTQWRYGPRVVQNPVSPSLLAALSVKEKSSRSTHPEPVSSIERYFVVQIGRDPSIAHGALRQADLCRKCRRLSPAIVVFFHVVYRAMHSFPRLHVLLLRCAEQTAAF